MKKVMVLILITLIAFVPISTYAAFSDVPQNASYQSALDRLTSLGIMSGYSNGQFKPDDNLTREQFAKIIVTAAGLIDNAQLVNGSTEFSDVSPSSWSSGYINVALGKEFIVGEADGKFHPSDNVTFDTVCTAIIRALGYIDQDVPGNWPQNYISKASQLGLTAGVSLNASSPVPRWQRQS